MFSSIVYVTVYSSSYSDDHSSCWLCWSSSW